MAHLLAKEPRGEAHPAGVRKIAHTGGPFPSAILAFMTILVAGPIWYWKGPAPHHFVSVPERESAEIKAVERLVTYGWGMIPVTVRIGITEYRTALWPRDGLYVVPIKAAVRKAENLREGDTVAVQLEISV